jgi:hypothetical protein
VITRPMQERPVLMWRGHSEATLTPQRYLHSLGAKSGYLGPIRRTRSFAFAPTMLPPVNKVTGSPRLYG